MGLFTRAWANSTLARLTAIRQDRFRVQGFRAPFPVLPHSLSSMSDLPPDRRSENDAIPPPEQWYPLPEFLEDFAATDIPGSSADYARYFFARYPLPDMRNFRVPRLIAARKYFLEHVKDFDRGSLAVIGKEQGIIKGRVKVGLWMHWARPEIDPKTYDPPIAEVIHTCENLPGDENSSLE